MRITEMKNYINVNELIDKFTRGDVLFFVNEKTNEWKYIDNFYNEVVNIKILISESANDYYKLDLIYNECWSIFKNKEDSIKYYRDKVKSIKNGIPTWLVNVCNNLSIDVNELKEYRKHKEIPRVKYINAEYEERLEKLKDS